MANSRPTASPGRGKAYFIHTWGCQMNLHDSERMAGVLKELGYRPTADESQAEVVLLNTCSVREKAAEKVFAQLGTLKRRKRENPDLIVGVCGCVAQQEKAAIFQRAPYVDLVFGPRAITHLKENLEELCRKRDRLLDTRMVRRVPEYDGVVARTSFPKAYITVMEGCNQCCTYCVIPFTRGREDSRPFDVLLAEAREVAAQGFQEVELLGQNVNAYDDGDRDFADLLGAVAEVEGIRRVRFTTSHPLFLSDRIIEAMAHPRVCPHLHLPVQSGADRVLAAMRREYTREWYLDRVAALRRVVPDLALTTDLIVGFPGETEAEYRETLALVRTVEYDAFYAFKYSPRPFTRAQQTLEDDVPDAEKVRRLQGLLAAQEPIQWRKHRAYEGREVEVLVDGASKRDAAELCGRTDTNKVVNFSGPASLHGQPVRVAIEQAHLHSLRGRLVAPLRETA